jgi:hypothetical protein
MTPFKDEEFSGRLPREEVYQDILKRIAMNDYTTEFTFIGGRLTYTHYVTVHIDITINSDRLRLDLNLGERFPYLGTLYKHVVHMMESFTRDGRIDV